MSSRSAGFLISRDEQPLDLLAPGKINDVQSFASGFIALPCPSEQLDFIGVRHSWSFHLVMKLRAGATP
jgi:hypothetical protein